MRHFSSRGRFAAFLIAASILGSTSTFAGELEDASAARARGDFAGALKLVRPLAEKGNAVAQHNMGASYFSGEGVPKDIKEAEKWFRLSATQGYAPAQSSLGLIKLMSKEYAEAFKWNQLAADQGYPASQVNLAIQYFEGQGVARDPVRAHMWMHLAALQNAPNAANFRDEIASKLTPSQLEQSLKLAKEWKPKG